MELKLRLRELREDNDYTQKQIAEMLHFTQETYSRYERGERYPSVDTLIKLADFYGVSLNYLAGRDNKKHK